VVNLGQQERLTPCPRLVYQRQYLGVAEGTVEDIHSIKIVRRRNGPGGWKTAVLCGAGSTVTDIKKLETKREDVQEGDRRFDMFFLGRNGQNCS
jgi:hypothetical protein